MRLFTFLVLGLLLTAVGVGVWYWQSGPAATTTYRTATVERGDLLATVSATGTIEPEEVIDVGAQVAGQIKTFGRDPRDPSKVIDYGTQVEEGTVLAQLDESLFQARVDKATALVAQARAQAEQGEADLKRADADLVALKTKLDQAEREWVRAQRLIATKGIAEADFDLARAAQEAARAAEGSGQAAVSQAKAARKRYEGAIAESEADLREAQRNLGYTRIVSPVNGIIIDRRVNVGQTVVASLNAPSLFLIAKDLRRLQVWASVNEADIGNVHVGQAVRFTVDAYPNEHFPGQVSQIRLNATMTQNVVTYTVVVTTDNAQGRLLPYLTANLRFEVARRHNVLLVPNAALRYRPQLALVHPAVRDEYANTLKRKPAAQASGEKERYDRATVWTADDGFVRPTRIRTGLTDGSTTELVEGDLDEGARLVVGEVAASNGDAASNPFTPQMFGGKKKE